MYLELAAVSCYRTAECTQHHHESVATLAFLHTLFVGSSASLNEEVLNQLTLLLAQILCTNNNKKNLISNFMGVF